MLLHIQWEDDTQHESSFTWICFQFFEFKFTMGYSFFIFQYSNKPWTIVEPSAPCTLQFSTVPNSTKQYQAVLNCSKQYQTVLNSFKLFQTVPNSTQRFQSVPSLKLLKVSSSLGTLQSVRWLGVWVFYWKMALTIFLIFGMKLLLDKGKKVTEPDFSRKIRFSGNRA